MSARLDRTRRPRRRGRALASLGSVVLLLGLAGAPPAAAEPGGVIESVTTDRALYPPGTPVEFTVALHNTAGRAFSGEVVLSFSHLGPGGPSCG